MDENKEYVCDREQCRYIGPPRNPSALEGMFRILTCGASCGILVGIFIAAIIATFLWDPLAWAIGILVFIFIVIGAYQKGARSDRCPACARGGLVDMDTERGRALVRRNRGENE